MNVDNKTAKEKSKYLRYGDYVFLHSSDETRKYLSARSFAEEEIFLLEPFTGN